MTLVLVTSCQLPLRFNCRLSWEFFSFLTSTMFPICTNTLWTVSRLDGMRRLTMAIWTITSSLAYSLSVLTRRLQSVREDGLVCTEITRGS
ncbi:hypothetical protein B0H14DRAFT_2671049 [Mycena olivaceomarginata]|nr:hypothetical protein B0H14DRAFT_2671049 [Mycena olivaceomarginata]